MEIVDRVTDSGKEYYHGQVDTKKRMHGLGRFILIYQGMYSLYEGQFREGVYHGYGRHIDEFKEKDKLRVRFR